MRYDTIQNLKDLGPIDTRIGNEGRSAILGTSEDAQRERLFFDDRQPYEPKNRVLPCDKRKDTLQSRNADYLEAKAACVIIVAAIIFALGVLIGHGWR